VTDALPLRWRNDRPLLSDRHTLARARVVGDDEGIVVLFDRPTGTHAGPTSPHEAAWWGVREGGRPLGVLGAGRRGGAGGADRVSLGVWAHNEPALRIYRRLGFRTDLQGRSYRPRFLGSSGSRDVSV
jgi:hypothetical protein